MCDKSFTSIPCRIVVSCGISSRFQLLSPSQRLVAHALLTRPLLRYHPKTISPFNLHVLSTPPAFVLSQDQTLSLKLFQRSLADVNKLIRSFRPSVCPGSSSQTLAFLYSAVCYFQGTVPVRRYRARNCILTNSFKFVNTVFASV